MARKRQYTTVRTDSTESTIAFYLAQHNYDAAEAVKYFARKVGIPIDESRIETEAKNICKHMQWDIPPHLTAADDGEKTPITLPANRPVGRPAKGSSWIETHRVTGKNGRVYEYKRQAWLENGRKRTKVIK